MIVKKDQFIYSLTYSDLYLYLFLHWTVCEKIKMKGNILYADFIFWPTALHMVVVSFTGSFTCILHSPANTFKLFKWLIWQFTLTLKKTLFDKKNDSLHDKFMITFSFQKLLLEVKT